MTEKRLLALLGFLLGLLGAVLILVRVLQVGRNETIDLDFFVRRLVDFVLGIGILLGSVFIFRGTTSSGGAVNLVVGAVGLLLGVDTTGAVLGIVSGILGIVASDTFR
ncbi:MAG: hypothetical protein A3K59_01570 [Euryarchaeota archaeon RBG_19FT_COMBO_69_17]|nr:MAG: hypothetical protein A3K59_01570 [Euryarchaeota archaeon RBG_19FT_COMBO_69_17]